MSQDYHFFSDPSERRRFFAELSEQQAHEAYPNLDADRAGLRALWARRSDTPDFVAKWRKALHGRVCWLTGPVLKHIAGDYDELLEWIRFADFQSECPLPPEVPETFPIYRGFNFAAQRRQKGLYWTPDIRIARSAIDWESHVKDSRAWWKSEPRSSLPEQGIITTVIHREDVLWWLADDDEFSASGIFEVCVDVHPAYWRRMRESEIAEVCCAEVERADAARAEAERIDAELMS